MANVMVFGGSTCLRIASLLPAIHGILWIVSICSDDRIQPELETQLPGIPPKELPTHLVIVGDFGSIQPEENRAVQELFRQLSKKEGRRPLPAYTY